MKFKLEGLRESSGWSVDELCDKCKNNNSECICNTAKELLEPERHQLLFRLEKRNGKPVTIVYPFYLEDAKIKDILVKLKKALGTGGTIKVDSIELQGDVKEKVRNLLEKMKFNFRNN